MIRKILASPVYIVGAMTMIVGSLLAFLLVLPLILLAKLLLLIGDMLVGSTSKPDVATTVGDQTPFKDIPKHPAKSVARALKEISDG